MFWAECEKAEDVVFQHDAACFFFKDGLANGVWNGKVELTIWIVARKQMYKTNWPMASSRSFISEGLRKLLISMAIFSMSFSAAMRRSAPRSTKRFLPRASLRR
jgi:hypothetical protein